MADDFFQCSSWTPLPFHSIRFDFHFNVLASYLTFQHSQPLNFFEMGEYIAFRCLRLTQIYDYTVNRLIICSFFFSWHYPSWIIIEGMVTSLQVGILNNYLDWNGLAELSRCPMALGRMWGVLGWFIVNA